MWTGHLKQTIFLITATKKTKTYSNQQLSWRKSIILHKLHLCVHISENLQMSFNIGRKAWVSNLYKQKPQLYKYLWTDKNEMLKKLYFPNIFKGVGVVCKKVLCFSGLLVSFQAATSTAMNTEQRSPGYIRLYHFKIVCIVHWYTEDKWLPLTVVCWNRKVHIRAFLLVEGTAWSGRPYSKGQ